jgi:hypothetical protein
LGVQGRLTLHAHLMLNTSEVTPQMLRDCLSDAASISVMQEVVDMFACADLPAAAVDDVLAAARAESGVADVCSSWTGVRAMDVQRNDDGSLEALKRLLPQYYDPVARQYYDDPADVKYGGRWYSAYTVDTPAGEPFEVLANGLAREHLR